MKSNFKILALIPARTGSKGVPKKNIMKFEGKSLLQFALDCAKGSDKIDKIILNSDDQNILDLVDETLDPKRILKQLRPEALGQDNSSIVDVVLNAIENLKESYDIILLLQVTSPIRTPEDIDCIIEYFKKDKNLEGVISVVPVNENHPARMYEIYNDKNLKSLSNNSETKHRQELKEVYLRNGCFYAIKTDALIKQKTFMPKRKKAYIMNPELLLNIDSPRDVIIARALIKAWKNSEI